MLIVKTYQIYLLTFPIIFVHTGIFFKHNFMSILTAAGYLI